MLLTFAQKQIGALYLINMRELLEAALLGLLSRVEGWSAEEVQVFIAQVRNDLKKKSVHLMQELCVVSHPRCSKIHADIFCVAMLFGPRNPGWPLMHEWRIYYSSKGNTYRSALGYYRNLAIVR